MLVLSFTSSLRFRYCRGLSHGVGRWFGLGLSLAHFVALSRFVALSLNPLFRISIVISLHHHNIFLDDRSSTPILKQRQCHVVSPQTVLARYHLPMIRLLILNIEAEVASETFHHPALSQQLSQRRRRNLLSWI